MLATAVELNERAACRAVVVTALTRQARGWWERLGFHPFDPDEADQFDLYLLTSEVAAALRRSRSRPSKGSDLLSARGREGGAALATRNRWARGRGGGAPKSEGQHHAQIVLRIRPYSDVDERGVLDLLGQAFGTWPRSLPRATPTEVFAEASREPVRAVGHADR